MGAPNQQEEFVTVSQVVNSHTEIPDAIKLMLTPFKNALAFDHTITALGQRFVITIIIQLRKK